MNRNRQSILGLPSFIRFLFIIADRAAGGRIRKALDRDHDPWRSAGGEVAAEKVRTMVDRSGSCHHADSDGRDQHRDQYGKNQDDRERRQGAEAHRRRRARSLVILCGAPEIEHNNRDLEPVPPSFAIVLTSSRSGPGRKNRCRGGPNRRRGQREEPACSILCLARWARFGKVEFES
jgi:hypothetical protein